MSYGAVAADDDDEPRPKGRKRSREPPVRTREPSARIGDFDEETSKRFRVLPGAKPLQSVFAPDDDPDKEPMKRKYLTLTLSRLNSSLGIAVNGLVVTAVHEGGAAALEGTLQPGDAIVEVNGKDTSISGFGPLLPADKAAPIRIRVARYISQEAHNTETHNKAASKLDAALALPLLLDLTDVPAVEARRKVLKGAIFDGKRAKLDESLLLQATRQLQSLPPPPEPEPPPPPAFHTVPTNRLSWSASLD